MPSASLSVTLRIKDAAAFSVTLSSKDERLTAVQFCPAVFHLSAFQGLTAVQFCPAVFHLSAFQGMSAERDTLEQAAHSLQEYCSGLIPAPQARLTPIPGLRGACLETLSRLPRGAVITYAELATASGLTRRHARAVGSYCAANPYPLFIPCHRVLPAHGTKARPGNYAGGSTLKQTLLQLDNQPLGVED